MTGYYNIPQEDRDLMEKLELQQKELRDRYNTELKAKVDDDYQRSVSQDHSEMYQEGQLWSEYHIQIQTYMKIHKEKNWKTHMLGKKEWYQHRNPMGCFPCQDSTLIKILVQAIGSMAQQYPDQRF